jgi:hypothetical protein
MKEIFSKKYNKNKKKKFKKYWRTLEPKKYVDLMVAEYNEALTKLASNKLKEVVLSATLRQTEDGFVYLDISNDIIHGVFSMIDIESVEKPPYFSKKYNNVGAHISVISDKEIKDNNIKKIKEIGKNIEFKLGKFYSTRPEGWDEMSEVFFIEIEAPELKKIRNSYGLPLTYENKKQEYHLTIAVKRKKK